MAHVWRNMRTEQIYKADSLSMLRSGTRWVTLLSLGWAMARWSRMRPRSLLDNSPLAALLNGELMPFERMFLGDRWGMVEDPFGIQWAIDEPAR